MIVFIHLSIFMNSLRNRFVSLSAVFSVVVLLSACVAKSGHDLRFRESAGLNVPSFNISGTEDGSFSFLFVGDMHLTGSNTYRLDTVLQAAQDHGDSFIVFLGDLIEKGARSDFETFKATVSAHGFSEKVIYVLGNHDIFEDGWSSFRELLGPSHYAISVGNCKFIILDSADGIVGEKQKDWMEDQLKQSNSSQHTFVLSHYMPVVPGQRTYLKLANESEAVDLMKMMSRFGVEAWLGGHYHSYVKQRIDNVNYIVAGGGGGRRMEPVRDLFFVRASVQSDIISYELNRF